ncbi:MAG TPA: hypothetical protein VHO68_02885 [Bacteroidales bacterium]|nr:hypothetical protein [Bacteroidales bacterium]
MKLTGVNIFIGCLVLSITSEAQDLESMGIKKGVKASGNISFSNIVYTSNDTVRRRDPYQLILNGNLNLNVFGYDAPFSFTFSNSQRSYTQPFNRLSFNPQYKWVRAHFGYTSMSFSPYTLSGHTFLGAGAELTPGNLRLAFMYGQLKKAVDYNPVNAMAVPSYRRMGYGMKLGYEKGSSGILFNVFNARDDENSIQSFPENSTLHPMKNLAFGLSGRTTLYSHLMLEGEYSVSILNSDTRYGSVVENDDEVGTTAASSATRTFDAYSFGAGYQSSAVGMMLKYERVDPDYQSLGAYYFNNDLENYTIAPTLWLLEGRFTLSGNAGLQRNNLDKSRNSTTNRFAGSGNVNLNLSEKLNMALNYSNFSSYTNIKPREDPFFRDDMDTLNFYQVTSQLGGSVNITAGKGESPGNIMVSCSYQDGDESGSGDVKSSSGFLSINASFSRHIKTSGLSFSCLYNLNSSDSPGTRTLYHGPGINLSKSITEKKINVSINSTYNISHVNRLKGAPVLCSGVSMNYAPGSSGNGKQNLTANITWVQRFATGDHAGRREITGTVSYSYSF